MKSRLAPISGLLIAALLIYAGISLAQTVDSLKDARDMTELLKSDVAAEKDRIAELERKLRDSEGDEACREAARDRLGLVDQGEIIFIDNYR